MCLRTNRFLGFIEPNEMDPYFSRGFYSIRISLLEGSTNLGKETKETEFSSFGDRQT